MTTHPRQAACPVALLAALLVACDAGGPAGPPQALTALPRPLSATESEALAGSANFGLGLLRETSAGAPGRNVVVSPLSASMALGMALNGAAAATRDSMRAVLGWGNRSDDEINAAYKGLATLLVSLDPQVRFTSANAVWINQGFPVLSPFVQVNRDAFGAQVANLDFTSGSAVGTVNRWVSGATSGRIPSIIDGFQSGDELLLVNALWFKGSWRDRFDPARTQAASFHGIAGDATVQMMARTGLLRQAAGASYQAVELPYGNGAFGMLIVMPSAGTGIDAFVDSLTPARWNGIIAALQSGEGAIRLPRFTLAGAYDLKRPIANLGMGLAFSDFADFSRISTVPLKITSVRQRTWIDVNEEGTEAAAATSVGIGVTSAPVAFVVDRPFVFAIRERFSGAILFLGKITTLPAPAS